MPVFTVKELVDKENHAWEEVKGILENGKNTYTIVPADPNANAFTLYRLQVSTRAYLGSVAYETGAILFDHGWITLLGSGGAGNYSSLAFWNGLQERESDSDLVEMESESGLQEVESEPTVDATKIKLAINVSESKQAYEVTKSMPKRQGTENVPVLEGMLVVAYDAAGGFFALDTGRFGHSGHIYYFAPDTLEWESTELAYSDFLAWLSDGDLGLFYQTFRWEGWQEETIKLLSGQVFAYYPPLWTEEGSGETSHKAPITIREAWQIVLDQK